MPDPTPLQMIYDSLQRIEEKQDDEMKCRVKMKQVAADHEFRIKKNEQDVTATQKMAVRHMENKQKHYNPHYSESLKEKVWRKKGELSVATMILFLVERIIDYINTGGT